MCLLAVREVLPVRVLPGPGNGKGVRQVEAAVPEAAAGPGQQRTGSGAAGTAYLVIWRFFGLLSFWQPS